MKRLLTIFFLFLLVSLNSSAQHLSFKGIPIDGNVQSFVNNLKKQGFVEHTLNGRYDYAVLLKGDFAGMEDCMVSVMYSKATKTVCKVLVFSDDYTSWSSVKHLYETLNDAFSKKYTQEANYYHFKSPYYDGDGYEIQALNGENALITAFYKAEGGSIQVELKSASYGKAYVIITYEDTENFSLYLTEKEKSVLSDI